MANNFLNRNSQYISSLVSYIQDTKPYHSKLTEVAEEYRFFDEMKVKMSEQTRTNFLLSSSWRFNHFSSGDSTVLTTPLKQLHINLGQAYPLNTSGVGTLKAFRDENTDFASIPFVYSKKTFNGVGVADVLVERQGNRAILEPMVEGHDFFQSHGGVQLQLKQSTNTNGDFEPLWSETRNDGLISAAVAATRASALSSSPTSAVNQIRNLLFQVGAGTMSPDAREMLYDLLAITQIPDLPRDYEPFLQQLISEGATPPAGFTGWIGNDGQPNASDRYVDEALSKLTPSLYFGDFSDLGFRESGLVRYEEVVTPFIRITNVQVSPSTPQGDAWRVVAADADSPLYHVFSLLSGYLGNFTGSTTFTSSTVSFTAEHLLQAGLGEEAFIQSRSRIVFSPDALLETWDIIKVNPLAYSRPAFSSTRYGYITNHSGEPGSITIFDPFLPAGTISLTATSATTFSVRYGETNNTALVNFPYNDGFIAFTIRSGSVHPFEVGDHFYVRIINEPARVVGLDVGYGYDLESYDNPNLVYNNTDAGHADYNRRINFVYDTRFTDYDLSAMNVAADESAIPGTKWRLRAIPNTSLPIATLKKDGSGPSVFIDLQEGTSGTPPDPALNAAPLYSMLGDANPAPDLALYYATSFQLESSLDDFNTVTSVAEVQVGDSYVGNGISFDLPAGSKPFVAVISDDGAAQPAVEGGDIFWFEIVNEPPRPADGPISLIGTNVPRLIMHGDSYHRTPPALWSITFSSSSAYNVVGSGTASGYLTRSGQVSNEGSSFKDLGVHFTIVAGAGLGPGDLFSFETFARKPSFLVHGSTTGWTEPAVVGEQYWNGHLGFLIEKPKARLFDEAGEVQGVNYWTVGTGVLKINEPRFDAVSSVYVLTPADNGWNVTRGDAGPVGFLPASGELSDEFITLTAIGVTPVPLKLQVIADDFQLWNAQDTVILKSDIEPKLPNDGDFVLIDKRTSDSLSINIDQRNVASPKPSLLPLGIDSNAVANVPIPLTIKSFDSATSVAEFSDVGTTHEVYASGSGQLIGTVRSVGPASNWRTVFEWDEEFFEEYLKLNTEVNFITYGSGLNDLVNARITESVRFLIGGGALTTDFLFRDDVRVELTDLSEMQILSAYADMMAATVADSPFEGFLPGFDNQPFDEEAFGFDTGIPLVDHYHQAQQLAGIVPMNAKQQTLTVEQRENRLNGLLQLIGDYLTNGDLHQTTLPQFLARLDADPAGALLVPDFGIPHRGLGIDVRVGSADATDAATDVTSTGIAESIIILAIDDPTSAGDADGFDVGPLDETTDSFVILWLSDLPPTPNPIGPLTTYEAFDTPLHVAPPSMYPGGYEPRVIQLNFQINSSNAAAIAAMPTPRVFIWYPADPAPIEVTIVDKIEDGRYQFSVPEASELKIYLQPGS